MGTWVYDTPVHHHENPATTREDKPVGSIFQCSCGTFFRVESTKSEYDQRENDSWWTLTWRELKPGERIQLNDGRHVLVGETWPFKAIVVRAGIAGYTGDPVLGGYRDR